MQAEALKSFLESHPITNPAWTMRDDGIIRATMEEATLGGGKVIYDPWGGIIMNSTLKAEWNHSEEFGDEIIGWDVQIHVDDKILIGHIIND